MKKRVLLFFCSMFLILLSSNAQSGFTLTHIQKQKTRTLKFGYRVLFQLNDKTVLDSTMRSCKNQETGVYQMRLTGLKGQDLIFNDSIIVPYSKLNWMFIQTPAHIGKAVIAFGLLSAVVFSFTASQDGSGFITAILLLPPSILLLEGSQKTRFTCKWWTIKLAETKP
ncbi:MAG: hypothetical protein CFE21_10675 [Bacteroidetes bacterium B1(2017)]|nr:MAG: hypothetical protein CFE21_10675 [Bacteroidetes bacterium B1(2017)]